MYVLVWIYCQGLFPLNNGFWIALAMRLSSATIATLWFTLGKPPQAQGDEFVRLIDCLTGFIKLIPKRRIVSNFFLHIEALLNYEKSIKNGGGGGLIFSLFKMLPRILLPGGLTLNNSGWHLNCLVSTLFPFNSIQFKLFFVLFPDMTFFKNLH